MKLPIAAGRKRLAGKSESRVTAQAANNI